MGAYRLRIPMIGILIAACSLMAAEVSMAAKSRQPEAEPFACNLGALSRAERVRYEQLGRKLAEARVETKELPSGYAFRLRKEALTLAELGQWVSAEHKCCPFFDLAIELKRNDAVWLCVEGREGIKEFIRAELAIGM